ncbi:hypothetical protein HWV62_29787 [Athelia sp. TMB]|nr:hypothetical protein HWV62_29787 [Athelia sp. TMB]
MSMEAHDWESVLQFVSEPMNMSDLASGSEKLVNEMQRPRMFQPSPQVPTPPASHAGTPVDEDEEEAGTLVSVSTTFYPGAAHDSQPADLLLMSKDSVFFYVHSGRLLRASHNNFNHLVPEYRKPDLEQQASIIPVPEPSEVLNIILHAIYNMSCAHYAPPFSALESAVIAMKAYGVAIQDLVTRGSHIYSSLMSHAPLCPIELYALAASHDLYDLAVATSSHLLSFPLSSLTDEQAKRMGPVYVKRLFFLHFGRAEALKRLLLNPPHPHAPTTWCDFTEQKKLTRAWALASAYLAWDARPGLFVAISQLIVTHRASQIFLPQRWSLLCVR